MNYITSDTIVAEITPKGRGGVSVVRISGDDAIAFVEQIVSPALPESGRHKFVRIINNADDEIIDDGVVSIFRKPHSFTGEDVVEIAVHGSPIIVNRLLKVLYELGCRHAEAGEFSYRAFLNGKIDLTQAEAISDLINSESDEAVKSAMKQLHGNLSKALESISENVVRVLSYCELELDFVDEDVEVASMENKQAIIQTAIKDAQCLLIGYQKERALREGVKVAIAGPPNVGKSSLFNVLVQEDRAIVNEEAGTTRDVISSSFIINGVKCMLSDTAGIRYSAHPIEMEGIRRSYVSIEQADLVLLMSSDDTEDVQIELKGKQTIHIHNKCDLFSAQNEDRSKISISAKDGININELKQIIYDVVLGDNSTDSAVITRERHYFCLNRAIDGLRRAMNALQDGVYAEVLAEELRDALSALDEITGAARLENILDDIFSKFCIGK